jgi:hypothetical protein
MPRAVVLAAGWVPAERRALAVSKMTAVLPEREVPQAKMPVRMRLPVEPVVRLAAQDVSALRLE